MRITIYENTDVKKEYFNAFDSDVAGKIAIANQDYIYDSDGNIRTYGFTAFQAAATTSWGIVTAPKGMAIGIFTGAFRYHSDTTKGWTSEYEIKLFNPILTATGQDGFLLTSTQAAYYVGYWDSDHELEFKRYNGRVKPVKDTGPRTISATVWRDFRCAVSGESFFPHTDPDYKAVCIEASEHDLTYWDYYFMDDTQRFIGEFKTLFNIKREVIWYGYDYKPILNSIIKVYPYTLGTATMLSVHHVKSAIERVERGICYSSVNTLPNLISDSHKIIEFGDTVLITGLIPDTTYYVAAYEKNAQNEVFYSDTKVIKTGATKLRPTFVPCYQLRNATDVSLSIIAQVQELDYPIIEKGLCYGTAENPTLETAGFSKQVINVVDRGKGKGFGISGDGPLGYITGLVPGTFYYVRAYAKIQTESGFEIVYSTASNVNELSSQPYLLGFATTSQAGVPIVTASLKPVLTKTSATITSYIMGDGGSSVTTSGGIYFGTEKQPWITGKKIPYVGQFSVYNEIYKQFTTELTNLTPGTTYYWCSYGINAMGEGKDIVSDFIFTTLSDPSIYITETKVLSTTSATINYSAIATGQGYVQETGVVYMNKNYATTQHPLPTYEGNNPTNTSTTLGNFVANLGYLEKGATYYVRPYMKRRISGYSDIYYGEVVNLYIAVIPDAKATATVQKPTVTAILPKESYKFTLSSNIDYKGTSAILNKGFILAPSTIEFITDKMIVTLPEGWQDIPCTLLGNGIELGNYSKELVIQPGQYRLVSYAKNSSGFSVSPTLFFTVTEVPTVIPDPNDPETFSALTVLTENVTAIDADSAQFSGKVTGDIRVDITEKGIAYLNTLDIVDPQNVLDTEYTYVPLTGTYPQKIDNTVFSMMIENLESGSTYLYRAYAKIGTSLFKGTLKSFTTLTVNIPLPVISITSTEIDLGAQITLTVTNGSEYIKEKGVVYKIIPLENATYPKITDMKAVDTTGIINLPLVAGNRYWISPYVVTDKETRVLLNSIITVSYKYSGTPDIPTIIDTPSVIIEDDVEFRPPMDATPSIGQKYVFKGRNWFWTKNGWVKEDSYNSLLAKINAITKVIANTEVEDAVEEKQPVNLRQLKVIEQAVQAVSSNHVVDMQYGQYLTDVLQYINDMGDASADYPYTINFYNHSKTINWDKFNAKVLWPRHVYLNFIGDISWWGDEYGQIFNIFDKPLDKLLIGLDFSRINIDNKTYKIGLPKNLKTTYFGGLSYPMAEYPTYMEMETVYMVEPFEMGVLKLVRVNGSKVDNIHNDALYRRVDIETDNLSWHGFVDVTPDFRYTNLTDYDLSEAYLYSAYFQNAILSNVLFTRTNLAYANFEDANLQNANLSNASLGNIRVNSGSNFIGVNLSGATGLPAGLDTKAEFIAAVGDVNVDATTIWIDGTSILS